ncbi:hypothetical protein FDO65_06320 [Nakamurella flava]|uniref:Uncharacterized protein n=1 Tax=Nakamurella flava TaxID=2576308 RepID=A0A4U6QL56_9ACTN|nr:hypothetical protein [Nakamurella flava]TKV61234.1 hypothetical protein FDO65_06320 [Nakamurella flava]
MTSKLDTRTSAGDRARARAYARDFLPGMAGYTIVLPLVIRFGGLDGTAPSRWIWALLPLIPLAWVAFAVFRHLRRIDEYQQRQMLQGLSIGFVVAMLAALTVGLLSLAGLDLPSAGWMIFGAGMAAWLLGTLPAGRRG